MNRRRFLSFLGLAPVAAAVPAMALPRPEKPTEIDKLTVEVSLDTADIRKMMDEIAADQAAMLAESTGSYPTPFVGKGKAQRVKKV